MVFNVPVDKTPVPENHWINWDEEDVTDTVLSVLGQVNDNLAAKEKNCYFAIVPSQQNGMELTFFDEAEKKE